MNILAILACILLGATLGIVVMSWFVAAGRADDAAERTMNALADSADVEREARAFYHDARKRANR